MSLLLQRRLLGKISDQPLSLMKTIQFHSMFHHIRSSYQTHSWFSLVTASNNTSEMEQFRPWLHLHRVWFQTAPLKTRACRLGMRSWIQGALKLKSGNVSSHTVRQTVTARCAVTGTTGLQGRHVSANTQTENCILPTWHHHKSTVKSYLSWFW